MPARHAGNEGSNPSDHTEAQRLVDRAGALLDEIPAAYKDIDQVMADQADLVTVLHTLHQVLNYKGT
jgi:RNA-splicing ligase RtcB